MASDLDDLADPERRLCEVLAAYFEADRAGQALDRAAWLACHPDLADQLVAFLEEQDRQLRMTEPLRTIAEAAGPGAGPGLSSANGDGAAPLGPGRDFGDYELLGEIARGGMGVVYRARQRGLNRLVALKMLRSGGPADGDDARRFRLEAEAVARLDHPNIVPIHEVGERDGSSYFTMKLIEGTSLAHRPPGPAADPRSAARLVAIIARAVHHAHQRGVLHRDLKPSNILIDAEGRPHVTDFGLARRIESDSELTQSGAILGTPSYMAPEQASGWKKAVTTATDVYGLGAVLYALVSGRPPFRGDSVLETLERVRHDPPEPPSRVGRRVDRDLETICLKCLEKDPNRRYGSAVALAEDIERWLRGEPIAARPAGPLERSWRWCRRHRVLVGTAMIVLAMAGLLGVAVWKDVQLRRASDLDEQRRRDIRRQDLAARRARYVADVRLAAQLLGAGRIVEYELDRQAPSPGEEDLREFAWWHLRTLMHQEAATLTGHRGEVNSVAFSPDGRTLASASQDKTVHLWDVAGRRTRAVLEGHEYGVNWVAWSPDGRTLATASDDSSVRLWDAASGRGLGEVGRHDREAVAVLFTPDGRSLISGGRDKQLRRWDLATRREVARWESRVGEVECLAVARRTPTLAVAGHHDRPARIVDWINWTDGRPLDALFGSIPNGRLLTAVALSGDGRLAAMPSGHNAIILDADGRRLAALHGHHGGVYSVAFSPDDRTLATASDDGSLRLWDVPSGRLRDVLMGHLGRIWCVTFSPDGRTLASAGRDGTVKLWDIANRPDKAVFSGFEGALHSLAFSPDGTRLLAAGNMGRLWSWDVTTGEPGRPVLVPVPGEGLLNVLSPDGQALASMMERRRILLSDPSGRRPPISLSRDGDWHAMAFSPDGSRLATTHADAIHLWDVASGHELARFRMPYKCILGCHSWPIFSPSGDIILCGNGCNHNDPGPRTNSVWLAAWDISTGRMLWLRDPGPIPYCLAWSADGELLAFAFELEMVLRDAASLTKRAVLLGHGDDIGTVCFSPDSRTLASAGLDMTVCLWDVATGQELVALRGHTGPVLTLRFSPDGRTLASLGAALDGSSELILWRTARPARAGAGPSP